MKQLTLLLLIGLLFGCQDECEEFFEPIAPDGFTIRQIGRVSPDFSTSSGLSYLQMVDATTGFMVSSDGLHKTTDGGATWVTTPVPSSLLIESVLFPTESIGYISYRDADGGPFLLKTTDGGASWANITIDNFAHFFDNLQTDRLGNLYALAGNFGVAYLVKSTDGGVTWTEFYASDAVFTDLLTVKEDRVYFMESNNDNQLIVLDLDGNLLNSSIVGGFEQLAVLDENNIISVGQNRIYKTIDGGNNWTDFYDRSGAVLDFSEDDGIIMLLSTSICSDRPIDPTSFARGSATSASLDISTKKIYEFDISAVLNAAKTGPGRFLLQYGNEIYAIAEI